MTLLHNFRSCCSAALIFLIGILICSCGSKKEDNPDVSIKEFFNLVGSGAYEKAYNSTATVFKTEQNLASFTDNILKLGIRPGTEISWKPDSKTDTVYKYKIEMKQLSGTTQNLTIEVLEEAGSWKIAHAQIEGGGVISFSLPSETIASARNTRKMPSDSELIGMVRESLTQFNEALKRKQFDRFYKTLSVKWQDTLSLGRLTRTFQSFLDQGVQFENLDQGNPVFSAAPQLNNDNDIVMEGIYPSGDRTISFKFHYTYEFPKWRLNGLDIVLLENPGTKTSGSN